MHLVTADENDYYADEFAALDRKYAYQKGIGYRIAVFGVSDWYHKTDAERMRAYTAFADELDAMPRQDRQHAEWADDLAYLCRIIVAQLKGENVVWEPAWKRRAARSDELVAAS